MSVLFYTPTLLALLLVAPLSNPLHLQAFTLKSLLLPPAKQSKRRRGQPAEKKQGRRDTSSKREVKR
jgi:hypothetical protein